VPHPQTQYFFKRRLLFTPCSDIPHWSRSIEHERSMHFDEFGHPLQVRGIYVGHDRIVRQDHRHDPSLVRKSASLPNTSLNGHMYSHLAEDHCLAPRLPQESVRERELFVWFTKFDQMAYDMLFKLFKRCSLSDTEDHDGNAEAFYGQSCPGGFDGAEA
jgi:hypothetical protein